MIIVSINILGFSLMRIARVEHFGIIPDPMLLNYIAAVDINFDLASFTFQENSRHRLHFLLPLCRQIVSQPSC